MAASSTSYKSYLQFATFLLACLFSIAFFSSSNVADDAAGIGLTIEEQTWLTFHPTIRIAPDRLYEPVEFVENDEHSGLTGDYFELLAKKLGVEFVLSSKETWSESLEALTRGDIDVLPAIQKTPEREKRLQFTSPYLDLNTVVITSNVNRDETVRITDLNGKKVAVVEGYFWNELLPIDYPEVEIVTVPNMAVGLQETALGTVDAFLGSFATASHYIDERDITNLRIAGRAPYQIEYAAAVRKDWPELASILEKAFKAITPEEHAAIHNKWIKLNYEPPFISPRTTRIILGLLGLTGLLALGSLTWSTSLQKQVQEKTKELKNLNESLEFKVYERTEDLRRAHERLRSRHRTLQDTNTKLEDEAHRDELTGIANRRRLDQFLDESIRIAQSMDLPLTIIMADIDYFKFYNDHYGHLIGDDCLREVAQTLSHFAKRTGELAARFGGEEFTLVIPGMNKEKSLQYAENLLQAVRDLEIENIKSPAEKKTLSISLGIYTHLPLPKDTPVNIDKLLELGDKALYEAKRRGRDQAMHYTDMATDQT